MDAAVFAGLPRRGVRQVACVPNGGHARPIRAVPRAGRRLAVIAVDPAEAPRVLPSRDGAHVRGRFQAALGLAA
jgi:phosphonopyruvate decarboxylase